MKIETGQVLIDQYCKKYKLEGHTEDEKVAHLLEFALEAVADDVRPLTEIMVDFHPQGYCIKIGGDKYLSAKQELPRLPHTFLIENAKVFRSPIMRDGVLTNYSNALLAAIDEIEFQLLCAVDGDNQAELQQTLRALKHERKSVIVANHIRLKDTIVELLSK